MRSMDESAMIIELQDTKRKMWGRARALGRRVREALTRVPWKLDRQDPCPRLQTCCQSQRMRDDWRASL
jgi:hypothetical protein